MGDSVVGWSEHCNSPPRNAEWHVAPKDVAERILIRARHVRDRVGSDGHRFRQALQGLADEAE
jgi:hypothetical protein